MPIASVTTANIGTPSTNADRKSTRLNSSHSQISYAVFCLNKKQVEANVGEGLSCGFASVAATQVRPTLLVFDGALDICQTCHVLLDYSYCDVIRATP